MEICIRI